MPIAKVSRRHPASRKVASGFSASIDQAIIAVKGDFPSLLPGRAAAYVTRPR